jgi:hypothetical protein
MARRSWHQTGEGWKIDTARNFRTVDTFAAGRDGQAGPPRCTGSADLLPASAEHEFACGTHHRSTYVLDNKIGKYKIGCCIFCSLLPGRLEAGSASTPSSTGVADAIHGSI